MGYSIEVWYLFGFCVVFHQVKTNQTNKVRNT
jgi:hypothetical protein